MTTRCSAATIEDLEEQLARRGIRSTAPRRVVFEIFASCAARVSVDELHTMARRQGRAMAHSTIGRTMRLLVEHKLASLHVGDDKIHRYELLSGRQRPYDYLVCRRCAASIPFKDEVVELLQERIASRYGFRLVHRALELTGLCASCQSRPESSYPR